MSLVIAKAIKLIDLVAAGTDTLSEIAACADMSRSTAHRLLATLIDHNYLVLEDKRYGLGYRLMELGEQKKRSLKFVDILRGILVRFAELTMDTIHLAILDGKDILLIDRVQGSRQLQIHSFVGQRAPAFMTAVGKVLIAHEDPREWSNYLRQIPNGYPKSREQLVGELRTARSKNCATDFNECDYGTCGIASSFIVNDRLRVACSINGATIYFEEDRRRHLEAVVREMAEELKDAANRSAIDLNFKRAQGWNPPGPQ